MFIQILLACLVSASSWAASPARVVVLELNGSWPASELAPTSALVRHSLEGTLSPAEYQIMKRQAMQTVASDMGIDHNSVGMCEVETGRILGADFVVSGSIFKMADSHVATLKVHNTATGALLASSNRTATSGEALLEDVPSLTQRLVQDWRNPPKRTAIAHPTDNGSTLWLLEKGGRIAVLEPTGDDQDLATVAADRIRSGLLDALPRSEFPIMTRENFNIVMQEMGLDPAQLEGECEVETGRNVGAKYVFSSSIVTLGGQQVMSIKLFDTVSGALIGAAQVTGDSNVALLDKIRPFVAGNARLKSQAK